MSLLCDYRVRLAHVCAALALSACADDSGTPSDDGTTTADSGTTSTGASEMDGDTSTGLADGTTEDEDSSSGDSSADDTTSSDTGDSSDGDDTTGDPSVCGDSEIAVGREDCEPGLDLLDTCASLGFDGGELMCSDRCEYETSGCFACGDDVVADAEDCEPGVDLGAVCSDLGFDGGTLACAGDCSFDTDACFTCGNGELETGEICEPGLPLAQACTDVGFDGGQLACTDSCTLDTSGCFECGDGELNPGEACDGDAYPDGFFQDNCAGYGHTGGILACTGECTIDDSACTDFAIPVEGEVIVTEIRKPPEDVGNAWFELHNLTGEPRQLNTCILSFAGAGLSFVDEFLIAPGGFAVVGTTDPVAGITPDYEFAVPLLGPFTQNIVLSCGGPSVDAVGMDGLGGVDFYELIDGMQVEVAPNASMQLDPSLFDATDNDDGSNWCASTSPIPGGTDFGTPGAPNDPC